MVCYFTSICKICQALQNIEKDIVKLTSRYQIYTHTHTYTQRGEIDTHTMLGYLKTMSSLCDPSGSLSAQPSKLQNNDNVTAEVPEAA